MKRRPTLLALFLLPALLSAGNLQLLAPATPEFKGWRLSHLGPFFPEVQGNLAVEPDEDSPSGYLLYFEGAFAGATGAHYVAAACDVPGGGIPFHGLKLRFRTPHYDNLIIRIYDGSGQFHQQKIAIKPTDDWQTLDLHDLHNWMTRGGANDGKWHDPVKSVWILIASLSLRTGRKYAGEVLFSDIILPEGKEVPANNKGGL